MFDQFELNCLGVYIDIFIVLYESWNKKKILNGAAKFKENLKIV